MSKKSEVLDSLEEVLILATKNIMLLANRNITDDEARNLIEKVGVRIQIDRECGKGTYDRITECVQGREKPEAEATR